MGSLIIAIKSITGIAWKILSALDKGIRLITPKSRINRQIFRSFKTAVFVMFLLTIVIMLLNFSRAAVEGSKSLSAPISHNAEVIANTADRAIDITGGMADFTLQNKEKPTEEEMTRKDPLEAITEKNKKIQPGDFVKDRKVIVNINEGNEKSDTSPVLQ